MPLAAAASSRTLEPASVPQVRIVFTPSALRLAACCGKSAGAGPHVTPLITQFLPLTRRAQLPCEPATRTLPSAGPEGSCVGGSVVGGSVGVVPVVATLTSQNEKP